MFCLLTESSKHLNFLNAHNILWLTFRYTIIDEADEMLNADWENELKKIMSGGGKLLFRGFTSFG